jgi:hypothetical protein
MRSKRQPYPGFEPGSLFGAKVATIGICFGLTLHPVAGYPDRRRSMKLLALTIVTIGILASEIARADSSGGKSFRSADGKYQLVLTRDWESADFHQDTVQIGATDKHTGEYVEIVADDRQDYVDSLEQYAEAKRDTMAMSLDNPRMTAAQRLTINGLDAMRFELHGQLPNSNVSIGYVLTVLKTKTHYIQVIGWTLESHFADNRAELEGLAGGFSETSDAGK